MLVRTTTLTRAPLFLLRRSETGCLGPAEDAKHAGTPYAWPLRRHASLLGSGDSRNESVGTRATCIIGCYFLFLVLHRAKAASTEEESSSRFVAARSRSAAISGGADGCTTLSIRCMSGLAWLVLRRRPARRRTKPIVFPRLDGDHRSISNIQPCRSRTSGLDQP